MRLSLKIVVEQPPDFSACSARFGSRWRMAILRCDVRSDLRDGHLAARVRRNC